MLIDRLLSLETGDLSNFRFTKYDFLIWPFVRIYIIENIYIKITSCSIPSAHREKLTFFENLLNLYKTLKYSPFNYSNYKIVFILTQIAATVKKDNKYVNRLHDYFALECPDHALIIEKSERRKYKLQRYLANVAFDYFIVY